MKYSSLFITLIYLVLGFFWIFISDYVLYTFSDQLSEQSIQSIQSYKGYAYVIFTCILLYALVNRFRRGLRHSEGVYKKLFEEHPQPLLIYDVKTTYFLAVNQAAIAQYGYTKPEFLKLKVRQLHPQEDRQKLKTHIAQLKDIFSESGIWKHKRKTGEEFYVEVSSHAMTFDGQTARVLLASNVHERVLMEEEIHNIAKQLADFRYAIINASIMSITDKQGKIKYVNQKFEEISGYSSHEMIGKTYANISSGYHDNTFYQELWETIQSKNVWRGEIQNRNAKGELFWLDTHIIPFVDDTGEIYQYLSIQYDITDRKIFQKRISEQNKYLREIAHISSHDIRRPVASILGLIQIFDFKNPANPFNLELLDHMKTMTNELDEVIHQIVDKTYHVEELEEEIEEIIKAKK
ncbi:MAG: PAS domain S-box protein [Bernardetiaceae bacterium]|nr:PAS domain S-box protein [Bernardetiaceae bacterium]